MFMVSPIHNDKAYTYASGIYEVTQKVGHQRPVGRRVPLDDDYLGWNSVAIELACEKSNGMADPLDISVRVTIVSHPSYYA